MPPVSLMMLSVSPRLRRRRRLKTLIALAAVGLLSYITAVWVLS